MTLSLQYRVDLRTQAQTHAKESLHEALADVKAQAVKGKERAVKVFFETEKLLERYETEEAGHNKEMQRIRDQIQVLNSKIDISILDVSTDCIDKCRTGAFETNFITSQTFYSTQPGDSKKTPGGV